MLVTSGVGNCSEPVGDELTGSRVNEITNRAVRVGFTVALGQVVDVIILDAADLP